MNNNEDNGDQYLPKNKHLTLLAYSVVISIIVSFFYLLYRFFIWDSIVAKTLLISCKAALCVVVAFLLVRYLVPAIIWLIRFVIWCFTYIFKGREPLPRYNLGIWQDIITDW